MKSFNHSPLRATILLSLSAFLSAASAADLPDGVIASPEADWPQWQGKNRNGTCEPGEKGLLATWPEGGPKLLWKADGLGRGWSSAIIAGQTAYITGDVGDELMIYAFDLDGKPRWKVPNGKSWKGSYPGARACLAYSQGRLFHVNAHGRVVGLDPATGKEHWSVNILERFDAKNITWAISECLLVDGNRLIVTPGGAKAVMAALDVADGNTVWTTQPIEGDNASYASPILFRHAGKRYIAGCSSNHGFGVDAETGKLLWTVPLKNRYHVTVTPPTYSDGRLFYVAPDEPKGTQYLLQPDGQGIKLVEAWKTELDTLCGGMLLVDGVMYGSGYRQRKHWWCVDWKTGQTLSELKDVYAGSVIYADGRLYCQAEDGYVAMLKIIPGGLEVAGKFRLAPLGGKAPDAWAHPVLLNGRLYLRYHDTLYCYDVRGEAKQ